MSRSDSTGRDLLVLGEKFNGLPPASLATALRDRLPEWTVTAATTPAERRQRAANATVMVGPSVEADLLADAPDLELFACAYAGYDHLPLDVLAENDVAVTTASGVHVPNVAEQAMGFVLTFARGLHDAWRRQQRREWRVTDPGELSGSTVAIVGLGAIGTGIAERLDPFGVETVGVRHSPEKGGPCDEVVGYDDLHDALARAEYVVLTCPLTDETEGLIGEVELHTLPTDAVIVNVARGGVIDTDALVAMLRQGGIRGAALDVTDPEPLPEDHPLWNFGNVLITPHSAGRTPAYHDRLADIVAENAEKAVDGRFDELRNRVALPD
ncbi:hydroxyacid dehydrogenase [Halorientalis sp. IM1011]|uniref:D-2-hydroxyacid dehydrogenase n=1 Tax=Halorientalis sp. IM1011 TaxID=1932360 RepID=UPI00097CCDBC|nr:D-2-hydroxyacid dehydrogenase [Halorientalis sp. IM1011]AQL44136.1 hydroxyacid dehydrogenase [Halorientalis sp. IM1011]